MLEHPYLKLAQRLRCDGLMREHVAVLRLSARAHEEHYEEACNFECYLVSVIFLNQRIPPVHRTVAQAADEARANVFPGWQKGAFLAHVDALKKQHAISVHPERIK